MPDIPVYHVQKENLNNRPRTLYRNMLLPFNALPCPEVETEPTRRRVKQPPPVAEPPEPYIDSSNDSSSSDSSDSEVDDSPRLQPVHRYVLPQRQPQRTRTDQFSSHQFRERRPQAELRRGGRERRPPDRLQMGQWQMGMTPHTFTVQPQDVVFI